MVKSLTALVAILSLGSLSACVDDYTPTNQPENLTVTNKIDECPRADGRDCY